METRRIYIPAYVRSEDDFTEDQREFDFIITSNKRDSYGTIFTSEGWDFKRYKQNPVVFYQHRSFDDDPDNLIGTTVKGPWKETLSDGSTVHLARVRFEEERVNKKAEKIRKKIIAGTLRMASIAADVYEYRFGDKEKGEDHDDVYFLRQELYEWSIVTLGSNPDANVKRNDAVFKQIRSELNDTKDTIINTENIEHTKGLSVSRARLELYKLKK